ncbi:hydantoinase/oxoprolinase family protein [Bradyrhizobium canariense]|uniref:N-methylhydantoinase A n=1 Tax=Bradyrhizobium canariense TaxID=255045 RepID=A0A1H1T7N7_9BRAD|nr:hydantoinase/oxoprolinase family protein [Bradyrhizobium canariense]SDS56280.1 N-methylhydantoinase A [Bradyrhizobium canariense]
MRRVGIDVGGTFTDVVLLDSASGEVWSAKVPTTPKDPTLGALNGLRTILARSGSSPASIDFIGHGTTIATNMVIEGKGALTALITTSGFRDILELRRGWRHDRADLYDLFFEAPRQLVLRRHRLEITERISYDGFIEQTIDPDEIADRIAELKAEGVEAIAVCLINSPINGENERHALKIIRERVNDVFVSGSIEVNPEIMEYERTCTTVMNALLGPNCGRYAHRFTETARGIGLMSDVYFMQSNGGLASPEVVSQLPVTLLASGPAGGVTAAARLCERLGIANAITGDMGGTSFDVSLIREGQPELRNSMMINTYTVRTPNIDIISIGAGGGSIAWIDEGGGVRIGPESAGAEPGPVCYGRGGTRPTVTDCNLILGYVDPTSFLGGDFALDVEAARRAIAEHLAGPLGVNIEEAAMTVRQVANALMAQAMRLATVERGYDPRDFIFIPYGGAGPVHAVDLARALEIPTVVLPPMPGLFSAFGMLVADAVQDLQASVVRTADDADPAQVEALFAGLEQEARQRLRAANVRDEDIRIERRSDCQYLGQGETIQVPFPDGAITRETLDRLAKNFIAEHRRRWNFDVANRPVRIVNLRLRIVGKIGDFAVGETRQRNGKALQPVGRARIYDDGKWIEMPRYRREDLRRGDELDGPLVVEEISTRISLRAGERLTVGDQSTILVSVGA